MSNGNNSSFNTSTYHNYRIWSSYGSSQSTQDTEVSYNYPDPSLLQVSERVEANVSHDIYVTSALHQVDCRPPVSTTARLRLMYQTQTGNVIGQDSLFKYIGYGATDALGGIPPNLNAAVRGVHGPTARGPPLGLQQQNYVSNPEPWSQFASSQTYATYPYPSPNVQRPSTQGEFCLSKRKLGLV